MNRLGQMKLYVLERFAASFRADILPTTWSLTASVDAPSVSPVEECTIGSRLAQRWNDA